MKARAAKGTRRSAHRLRGDASVNLGSAHTAVAKQRLNDANVSPALQQVSGKGNHR